MKYIIDKRFFDGTVITSMSDDKHSDYGGQTLEELRLRDRNPNLIAVSEQRVGFLFNRYKKSLEGIVSEITAERYWDLYGCVPPARIGGKWFFVGEPYFSDLYPFCFTHNGRYYMCLLRVNSTNEEIEKFILERLELTRYAPRLFKGKFQWNGLDFPKKRMEYIPYYFQKGEDKYLIYNLGINTGSPAIDKRNRNELARSIHSLRSNHFQYFSIYAKEPDVFKFLEWVKRNNYTLKGCGNLFSFNGREYVDFMGNVWEYSAAF